MTTQGTFAQALNEAKILIQQQSQRIKTDAEKMRAQAAEIEKQRQANEELAGENQRLKVQLEAAISARQCAEGAMLQQRTQLESLESMIADQRQRLDAAHEQSAELQRQIEELRGQLPSDEDVSALTAMTNLLQKVGKRRPETPETELRQAA